MHPALYIIPIIPAIVCWLSFKLTVRYFFRPSTPMHLAGFKFQGLLPRYKQEFANSLAKAITKEIIDAEFLQQKLTGPETLEKTKPLIESHIDNFLQHKLKTALPVVAMFIGEKITAQLKELFMKELEELFPSIMSQFISGLSQSDELANEIVVKLTGIQIETIEEKFYEAFRKELLRGELVFAFVGLITGIIQLVITLALLK